MIAGIVDSIELVKSDISDNNLLEFRIDLNSELISKISEAPQDQVILTYRSIDEGGRGEESDRYKILSELSRIPTGFIDLEISRDAKFLAEKMYEIVQPNIILSSHQYLKPMRETYLKFKESIKTFILNVLGEEDENKQLPQLIKSIEKTLHKKIIIKFVGDPIDTVDYLKTYDIMSKHFERIICLGLNNFAHIGRTANRKLNQYLIFASLNQSQRFPSVTELNNLVELNGAFTGLIGDPIEHSLSPLIHNQLFESLNLSGYYHLLKVNSSEDLGYLINKLQLLDFTGTNVTIPYKEDIIQHIDSLYKEAEELMSVNTIKFEKRRIKGYNTDCSGFSTFLRSHGLEKSQTALVYGAGGASKAVIYSLLKENIEVTLVNRSLERAETLKETFKGKIMVSSKEQSQKQSYDLFVNCTPLGRTGDISAIPEFGTFNSAMIDLSYSTKKTGTVKLAEKLNLQSFDGKEMLFHQAVDSFEIWFDKEVDREPLLDKFLKEVSQ